MRKVRREVIRTINDVREKYGHPGIFTDPYTNEAANEYAQFLLTEEDNEAGEALQAICKDNNLVGPHKALVGIAHLEEDVESPDKTRMEEFMDAHGLLLELADERG